MTLGAPSDYVPLLGAQGWKEAEIVAIKTEL